jgi:protein TonB
MMAQDKRLLWVAICASLVLHAALLTLRFAPPAAERAAPFNTGLSVILVNAKHDYAPMQPDALAQANLDGGGAADAGRARSPLPDLGRMNEGTQLEAQRQRVTELERTQRRLLSQLNERQPMTTPVGEPNESPQLDTRHIRSVEQIQAMARREAEIARDVADYNKRPVKTQLTPSTREVSHALYYTALQKKIELTGTLNFPQHDGKKMYGDLVVYIPVYQDGSLYLKEGGPRIERSSGNSALDAAALVIVRQAAPFGHFPAALMKDGRERVWEIITRFSFTREQQLQTQSVGR